MCVSALGLKSIINPNTLDIYIIDHAGNKKQYNPDKVLKTIAEACQDIEDSSKAEQLYSKIESSLYNGMTVEELNQVILASSAYYLTFDRDFESITNHLTAKFNNARD